jgi:hypothetical protein
MRLRWQAEYDRMRELYEEEIKQLRQRLGNAQQDSFIKDKERYIEGEIKANPTSVNIEGKMNDNSRYKSYESRGII